MGGQKKEDEAKKKQLEVLWRTQWDQRMERDEREKKKVWEEETVKQNDTRKKELEEMWRKEWDQN